MGFVFTIMLVWGIVLCVINGDADVAIDYMLEGADSAIELSISLAGSYVLWMGIMNVANRAGLIDLLAKKAERPLRLLMPDIGEAAAPVTLNLAANFFGLGNAATPFGLDAMKKLNKNRLSVASNSVCMFLVLNASAIEILPTTVIAVRAACGSQSPLSIALPTFISSVISAISAIVLCKIFQLFYHGE